MNDLLCVKQLYRGHNMNRTNMQEPIISVEHKETDSGWMVCCYISFLASEDQAINIENVLMDMLCSEEINKQ